MPSFLIPQNPDFFDEWVAKALAAKKTIRISARSPWQGYTPDLDPHQAPPTSSSSMSGLVARPDPGGTGEVLMQDAGFSRVDSARLPLTSSEGGGFTNITMLAQFNRTNSLGAETGEHDTTFLALVGGDNSTAGSTELWRLKQDGTWENVAFESSTGSVNSAHEPQAGREFLSDWAEFPAGAPNRDDEPAYSGSIDEPVFVWCNLQDRVMVYPNDNTSTENAQFEPLTNRFSATFKAATVEHFGGRLYFGNTIENTTQHRQRIRRTALFTADPLETTAGAGAFDIRDFSGDLLRLEKLADLLVAYFTDGVAFIRTTDVATSPDRVQLLRERRGLLSTHSVVSVGAQEHFGIFDDGWFFLDPSGRWTEVGMVEIDGVQTPKWKETFYGLLDITFRHRTVVSYDGKFVRIAFTAEASSDPDNQEVWIFDPRGNRVFRESYPVTVWGDMDRAIRAGQTWSSLTDTWSDLSGTWKSLGSDFGLKALHHGTTTGHVLSHDYDAISQFDIIGLIDKNPSYNYVGMLSSIGDPTVLKKATKLWVEHIHSGPGSITMSVLGGNDSEGLETGSVSLDSSAIQGDVNTVFRNFNFSSANLRYSVSGTAPVRIRSIMADVDITASEERITAPSQSGGGGGG